MRISLPKLAVVWLCGCAAVSAGLLSWPQVQTAQPKTEPARVYGGVEHQVRKAGTRPGDAAFVFTSNPTTPQATPQAASPALVGIVGRAAYLKSASSGETVSVAVGESLDGWKVTAVRGRTVTLEGPGGHHEMSLFEKPASVTSNARQGKITANGETASSTLPPLGD